MAEPGNTTTYDAVLPSGTLTYFLTDVEGSTELWEHEPEAMRDALARHDALIVAGVENPAAYSPSLVDDAFRVRL